jgi:HK97 family phage prohead protease
MPKFIAGYAAVFYNERDPGTEYQIAASVRERISPTAFDQTLKSKDDVVAAFNHNTDFLLGRRSNGTLRLSVDKVG